MKKHNEGYVLPFVLVVLVVVCIVALSLMSSALSNLQRQQASIERMKAKYEAQGAIEEFVADLEASINREETTVRTGTISEDLGLGNGETKEFSSLSDEEKEKLKEKAAEKYIKAIDSRFNKPGNKYTMAPSIDKGVAVAEIVATIDTVEVMLKENADPLKYNYLIKVEGTVIYTSYTISHEGGGS